MEKDDRKPLGTLRKEGGHEPAEERMEDWFQESVATNEFEEGEVVRGRVVHVGSGEILVRSTAVSAVTFMATAGGALFLLVAWARRALSRRPKTGSAA